MSDTPNVDAVELEVLREFYDCWQAFHNTQKTERVQLERAAQRLADASNAVKAFREAPVGRPN